VATCLHRILAAGIAFCAAGASAAEDLVQQADSVASMIRAGLPLFEAKADLLQVPVGAVGKNASTGADFQAPAGVVRMQAYVTREKRVLSDEAVLSDRGLEEFAMDNTLGPIDGLDRGILNVVTLRGLWAKIPVLNRGGFAGETNPERALRLYRIDRRSEILREKQDFDILSRFEHGPAGK